MNNKLKIFLVTTILLAISNSYAISVPLIVADQEASLNHQITLIDGHTVTGESNISPVNRPNVTILPGHTATIWINQSITFSSNYYITFEYTVADCDHQKHCTTYPTPFEFYYNMGTGLLIKQHPSIPGVHFVKASESGNANYTFAVI